MKNAKYQIRYNHTSNGSATSKAGALGEVKRQGGVDSLVTMDCDDGLYCYLSQEDADRDDTGARAFAVICGPGQQNPID